MWDDADSEADPFFSTDCDALEKPPRCCSCGSSLNPMAATVIKRGALTIERDNFAVAWRGKPVPLSPTETQILASVAARGYASFRSISELLADLGLSPKTRDVLVHRIRRKFLAIGASAPFARCGNAGIRLVVEPDQDGSMATVIGLRGETTTYVTN